MKPSVAIIDYGMGNLHSVASALAQVSPDSHIQVTDDRQVIVNADKVVFPGVGAMRACMAEIRRLGFDQVVADIATSGKPMLAICVGMQALFELSEENNSVEGIGLLPGRVRFFGDRLADDQNQGLKVPHMGWNQVEQTIDHPLWYNIDNNSRFYFVHSYYVESPSGTVKSSGGTVKPSGDIAGLSHYGRSFTAAISRDNVFATQFHPEKSHTAGLQLLNNFIQWDG